MIFSTSWCQRKPKYNYFYEKKLRKENCQKNNNNLNQRQPFCTKKGKNDKEKSNYAVDILHEDGIWNTADRVDPKLEKIMQESNRISKIKINLYINVFALDKSKKQFTKLNDNAHQFTLDKHFENFKNLIEHVKKTNQG